MKLVKEAMDIQKYVDELSGTVLNTINDSRTPFRNNANDVLLVIEVLTDCLAKHLKMTIADPKSFIHKYVIPSLEDRIDYYDIADIKH